MVIPVALSSACDICHLFVCYIPYALVDRVEIGVACRSYRSSDKLSSVTYYRYIYGYRQEDLWALQVPHPRKPAKTRRNPQKSAGNRRISGTTDAASPPDSHESAGIPSSPAPTAINLACCKKVCRLRSRSYIFPQLYRNLTYIAALGPFRIRTLGCCRLRRSSLRRRSRLRQIRRGRRTRPRGRRTRYRRRPGRHGRPGVCSR